jgi:hypothetical protein
LESLLEQLGSGATLSEIDSSSSSSISKSSKKRQSKGKRRPCLIWKIKPNGIEILPIATFGGRNLATTTTNNNSPKSLSNQFLLKRALSIYPMTPPPTKTALTPKIIEHMPKPLSGYVLLIPTLVPYSTSWPEPMPVLFDRSTMLYINSELKALITALFKEKQEEEQEEQMKMINDMDDSVPTVRGYVLDLNDYNTYDRIEKWLNECKLQ